MVGCLCWPLSFWPPFVDSAPKVTPWYNFTLSPILVVSPITTPVPWSMKKLFPILALSMVIGLFSSCIIVTEKPTYTVYFDNDTPSQVYDWYLKDKYDNAGNNSNNTTIQ